MTDDRDDDKPKVISGIKVFMFLLLISAIGLGPTSYLGYDQSVGSVAFG